MQSNTLITLALSAALATSTAPLQADPVTDGQWDKQVRVVLGSKTLSHGYSSALATGTNQYDELGSIGFLLDLKRKHWPVAIAIDLFGAGDEQSHDGDDEELTLAEAHLGFRLQCDEEGNAWHPYVGAGVVLAQGETVLNSKTQESKRGNGYWLGVGASYSVTETLSLGADLRYSDVDFRRFNGAEFDASGTRFGLSVGYRF